MGLQEELIKRATAQSPGTAERSPNLSKDVNLPNQSGTTDIHSEPWKNFNLNMYLRGLSPDLNGYPYNRGKVEKVK